MTYTYDDIQQRLANLPEDIKEVLFSFDTTAAVKNISQKHKLHVDQIGALADQIGLSMIGLLSPKDFAAAVEQEVKVDAKTAVAITEEVNEVIFKPVRLSLQKLHEEEEKNGGHKIKMDKKPAGVFEEKMGKLFRIPREEVELDPYNEPIK